MQGSILVSIMKAAAPEAMAEEAKITQARVEKPAEETISCVTLATAETRAAITQVEAMETRQM